MFPKSTHTIHVEKYIKEETLFLIEHLSRMDIRRVFMWQLETQIVTSSYI